MKRIFTLIILLLTVAILTVSCTDTEHTESGSKDGSLSSFDASSPNVDKEPENNQEAPKEDSTYITKANASISYEENEYYSFFDLGNYLGRDIYSDYGSHFRILETYEEIVNLTTNGRYFNKEMFEDCYVVVIYRYAGYRDDGVIGYKDLKITDGNASITLNSWSSDLNNIEPWDNTVFLRVPKSEFTIDTVIGGEISVTYDDFYNYESTYVEVEAGRYKNNDAWIVSYKEIDNFLKQNGIESLDWGMLGGYIKRSHTYLAIYMETVYPESIGYGNLTIKGDTLTVKREYEPQNKDTLKSIIELVAIPTKDIRTNIDKINICQTENSFKSIPYSPVIIKTELVEKESYNYYDFVDLGVYYYEEELRDNNAFHIITSYEELEKYTEKAYNLTKEFFKTNVVVALKISETDILDIYGIRNIGFGNSAVLQATIETGKADWKEYDSANGPFQFNICYVSVPREDIYRNYYQNQGKLSVTKNNLKFRPFYNEVTGVKGYDVPLNTVWFLNSGYECQSFYNQTGIKVTYEGLEPKFQLAYYGYLGENPQFYDIYSNEGNLYINASFIKEEANEPRYYFIEIDWSHMNCIGNIVTVHLIKREQAYANTLPSKNTILELNSSFYASAYNSTYLTKIPDFEWKLIQNSTELEEIIKGYTNILEYEEIDFEKQLVIAYYHCEGCTDCAGNTYFGNIRVANGKMYVDKYKEPHMGGAAMTDSLYFIIVNREKVTEAIENIVFIKRRLSNAMDGDALLFEKWDIIVNSESYEMQIISTIGISSDTPIKKEVDFDFKFIESKDSLLTLLNEYTNVEAKKEFLELDFESKLIIALYEEEGGGAYVGGRFRNLILINDSKLVITHYYPKYEDSGIIDSDDAIHPTIYLIAVDKNFDTSKIDEIKVVCSLFKNNHKDFME